MVKEYKILMRSDQSELEMVVFQHLSEGWELQGGVAIGIGHHGKMYFAQTIIQRYEV